MPLEDKQILEDQSKPFDRKVRLSERIWLESIRSGTSVHKEVEDDTRTGSAAPETGRGRTDGVADRADRRQGSLQHLQRRLLRAQKHCSVRSLLLCCPSSSKFRSAGGLPSSSLIQHSIPAQNIHRIFFPTHMNPFKLRHFHRFPMSRRVLREYFGRYAHVRTLTNRIKKMHEVRTIQLNGIELLL